MGRRSLHRNKFNEGFDDDGTKMGRIYDPRRSSGRCGNTENRYKNASSDASTFVIGMISNADEGVAIFHEALVPLFFPNFIQRCESNATLCFRYVRMKAARFTILLYKSSSIDALSNKGGMGN